MSSPPLNPASSHAQSIGSRSRRSIISSGNINVLCHPRLSAGTTGSQQLHSLITAPNQSTTAIRRCGYAGCRNKDLSLSTTQCAAVPCIKYVHYDLHLALLLSANMKESDTAKMKRYIRSRRCLNRIRKACDDASLLDTSRKKRVL